MKIEGNSFETSYFNNSSHEPSHQFSSTMPLLFDKVFETFLLAVYRRLPDTRT